MPRPGSSVNGKPRPASVCASWPRSEPTNSMVPRSWPGVDQRLGDGQGRLQVARRAPAGHQGVPPGARAPPVVGVAADGHARTRRRRWAGGLRPERSCRAMFIRMPTAARVITSDEPPKEMNGSGMPVTGSTPMTAPMLMTAWLVIQVVTPTATQAAEAVGGPSGRPEPVPGQREEQPQDGDGADEAELLAHHREDEVGVGVGQGAPLLPPAAQPEAEEVARPEPDERLPDLVARARTGGRPGSRTTGSGPGGRSC